MNFFKKAKKHSNGDMDFSNAEKRLIQKFENNEHKYRMKLMDYTSMDTSSYLRKNRTIPPFEIKVLSGDHDNILINDNLNKQVKQIILGKNATTPLQLIRKNGDIYLYQPPWGSDEY